MLLSGFILSVKSLLLSMHYSCAMQQSLFVCPCFSIQASKFGNMFAEWARLCGADSVLPSRPCKVTQSSGMLDLLRLLHCDDVDDCIVQGMTHVSA